ncbi:type I-E CRISPR-associated protein Cas6/Cse3/CasE [Leptospira mayottensis]|uniref:type I-E CRISPR-associated protein Cas6/Cse3/CasE n=1 Tax=Leptospira mayottensis TaxID=1137606 RepID=UPI0002BDC13B|nr:type I-E CRISPR-associated protein Cas6/Cse3/CasE [Leptospira mayottensis]AXR60544.1 type I-E CRISPR-associated protein Cas6/Cse3/CasE [Leptospira mayottensis]AZQ03022.1 type I-E CRISPR-associated protein Cas6/Cse3/CasE [Leptospira mayottensis 200901116]TGN17019.1 type I-E CRISPR-associated protein Cas6/Cse3/CasE [Leptospira mayottensis]
MFLSQLKLDTLNINNKIVFNWIQNPYNIHQRLWMAFPEYSSKDKLRDSPFLFQLDYNSDPGKISPRILVLSEKLPNWERAFQEFKVLTEIPVGNQIKQISPTFIQVGTVLRFSLTANPTKKRKDYRSLFKKELEGFPDKLDPSDRVSFLEGKSKLEDLKKTLTKDQFKKLKSKRIGIYHKKGLLDWLSKKGNDSGFSLLNAVVEFQSDISANKIKGSSSPSIPKIHTVTFSGILKITDPVKFKLAYSKGIGPSKAFGCGMLLLAKT